MGFYIEAISKMHLTLKGCVVGPSGEGKPLVGVPLNVIFYF